MAINNELLDQLMKGYEKPGDLLGKDGLFMFWPIPWRSAK